MILKKKVVVGAAAVAMLTIILDSRTALTGAMQGVNLCVYTVIPSLFPLFMFSHYLTYALSGTSFACMRYIAQLCGVPKGGESLLVVGLIGGYPVGAQCIKNLYDKKVLSKNDSERLLGFCSNAGPAFIFGMVSTLFTSHWIPWLIWIIQIFSALITGILLPGKRRYSISYNQQSSSGIITSLQQSIRALANVCGWVILFRMFGVMITKWFLWLLPVPVQVIFNGVIELVNGCNALRMIPNEAVKMILCTTFLSFGGICVCMQTMSVVGTLGIRSYLKGKLLQTVISGILAAVAVGIIFPGNKWMLTTALLLLSLLICWKQIFKKSVAFRREMIYNTKKSL